MPCSVGSLYGLRIGIWAQLEGLLCSAEGRSLFPRQHRIEHEQIIIKYRNVSLYTVELFSTEEIPYGTAGNRTCPSWSAGNYVITESNGELFISFLLTILKHSYLFPLWLNALPTSVDLMQLPWLYKVSSKYYDILHCQVFSTHSHASWVQIFVWRPCF